MSHFAILAVLCICFGSDSRRCIADGDRIILWRTPIHFDSICSLTGNYLRLPDNLSPAIRAWVGLRFDDTGGPASANIIGRHKKQLTAMRKTSEAELQGPDAANEIASRLSHTTQFIPRYFDVALVQHAGQSQCAYYADSDLDQRLDRGMDLTGVTIDELRPDPQWLRIKFSFTDDTCSCTDAGPPEVVPPTAALPSTGGSTSTDAAGRLSATLKELDHPAVRKQNLMQIVSVADALIQELERQPSVDTEVLSDVVYRKGRALGYRELPDVLARVPIDDPAALDRAFESTFAKLSILVDVRQPEYVLLAIRRERRRGHRGTALDLLQIYRRSHPSPDWYHKKRSDLIRELNLPLAAHQAAADLWLNGKQPPRPVPVVVVRKRTFDSGTFSGSWSADPPWRTKNLAWQSVDDHSDESVVWLPANRAYTVTGQEDFTNRLTTNAEFVHRGVPLRLNDLQLSF